MWNCLPYREHLSSPLVFSGVRSGGFKFGGRKERMPTPP